MACSFTYRFSVFVSGLLSLSFNAGAGTPSFEPVLSAALQTTVTNLRRQFNLEGLAAVVYVNEQCQWAGAVGSSARESNPGLDPAMTFGFASISKTFIAALVLQLAETNLLSLDDPLHKWLPNYRNINNQITIRQLLGHTSGIYNYLDHPGDPFINNSDPNRIWQPEEILSSYVLAPRFLPGTNYGYSNTNYLLLGMIIEAVTGNAVETELANRIFVPFNLQHTFLGGGDLLADLTRGVNWSSATHVQPAIFSKAWTAYGIASTVGDIARWGQNLYSGKVLQPSSLAQMLQMHPTGNYGLGAMGFTLDRYAAVGHVGHSPGFKSGLAYIEELGVTLNYAYHYSNFAAIPVTPLMLTTLARTYVENLPASGAPCKNPQSQSLVILQSPLANFSGVLSPAGAAEKNPVFRFTDQIQVHARIDPDPADVGTTGQLYAVICHDNVCYEKTADVFTIFAGSLETLKGVSAPRVLQATEILEIVAGMSGIAGDFLIYTAYSNAEGKFRYSDDPIRFRVSPP